MLIFGELKCVLLGSKDIVLACCSIMIFARASRGDTSFLCNTLTSITAYFVVTFKCRPFVTVGPELEAGCESWILFLIRIPRTCEDYLLL